MKRIAQFAAALAIAFLAVQPVLGSLPCRLGPATACASGCSMAMNVMGPDCMMQGRMAEAGCPRNCCDHSVLQSTLLLAAQSKSRHLVPSPLLAQSVATAAADPIPYAQAGNESRGGSPPRYILNQVFRI